MTISFDRILGRVVTCLGFGLVVSLVLCAALFRSPGLRSFLGWTGTYAVGQRIDTPDIYSGSRFTIILFARSSCGACQAAKPQLRAIANLASTYLGVQMIVVPASDWSPEEGAYIHDLGLREEAVRHLSVSELKVRMVPTLVVVDQRGRIQLVQEGAPTSKEEIAIRNLVRGSNH